MQTTDERAGDTRLQAAARTALWALENMTTEDFQVGRDRATRKELRAALEKLDEIRERDRGLATGVSAMTRQEQNEYYGEGGVNDAAEDQAFIDRAAEEAAQEDRDEYGG